MRNGTLATVAAVGCLTIAGCGGDESDSAGKTGGKGATNAGTLPIPPAATTPTTPTIATSTTATTATTSVSREGKSGVREAFNESSTTEHLRSFQTAGGNIGCVIAGGSARCDIRTRDWVPPEKPRSCRLDYGQGLIVVGTRRGAFVCAGDTARDTRARVLRAGHSSVVGDFTCANEAGAINCSHRLSGHGFLIARGRYLLF